MAAFNRLTEATYEIHESVKVDTQDNEDHTFCGIMFPVKCKDLLPVDHISVRSLAVRGQLGPMTVWISKEDTSSNAGRSQRNSNATTVFHLSKSHWNKIYEKVHQPSPTEYVTLELDQPIILKPGQVRAIYIHSTLPGDQAIVYDNAAFYFPRGPFGRHHANANNNARRPRYEDSMIQIHTGRAHVSNSIFGQMPIWGWGNAWRDHREFVGQIHYGAVYQLWNPETQIKFGPHFKEALFNLKLCQTRWESPVSKLPDECIFYILNMCRWDWFQDSQDTMQVQQRQQQQRQRQLELEQQQLEQEREEEAQRAAQAQQAAVEEEGGNNNNAAGEKATCCCTASNDDNDNSEAEYEDALENVEEVDNVDDEDEDYDMEEEDEVDEGDDDDDTDDEWEAANGYRADHSVFRFIDPEQEEEEDQDEADEDDDEEGATHQAWIQRQFQRIHVLRALARQQDDDEDVVDMHLAF